MKKIIFLLICTVLILCGCATTMQTSKINYTNSISELRKVKIGNAEQKILIRSNDLSNPIILFIHGGPGSAETPLLSVVTKKIEDKYTIVMWDQRGCGNNYSCIKNVESINESQIISDTKDLISYLLVTFNKKKLFIVGHSWGTVVGLKVINEIPNKIAGYIGIGQIVDFNRNELISYEFTLEKAKAANNHNDINMLDNIGEPINGMYKNGIDSLYKQRELLVKYGGALYNRKNYNEAIGYVLKCKEYSILDKINYLSGMKQSLKAIWNSDLLKTNFIDEIPQVNVPVFFFSGKYDFNTPYELVNEYYTKLVAPHKEYVVFDKSAHSPIFEEQDNFCSELVRCFQRCENN